MKILLIDDEPTLLETVDLKLQKEGYSVFSSTSAEEGWRLFKQVKPDLVVLDVMLPNRSGFDLCKHIRKEHQTPIIFVTARDSEADRLTGLELGGDDYLVKPFNLSELAARIKAILRRTTPSTSKAAIEIGNIRLDPMRHEAFIDGEPAEFAPKEFALLSFLMQNPGQVFSREQLLDRVWGQDAYVTERTVDVHVRWVRKRIERDPANPVKLVTVRGVGYKFVG